MKIMVVGGGGREHAIIKKLKGSKNVTEIFTSFVNQICPVTPSTHPSCDMIYP